MNAKKAITAGLKLRRLNKGDRAAVLAIEAESFPTSTLQFSFADYCEDADSFGIVAVENDNVAGYMLCEKQGDHIYLAELAVAKQARRRGIGRTLVTRLIQRLSYYRRDRIELDVSKENKGAIACYDSLGFVLAVQSSGRSSWTMEFNRPVAAGRKGKSAVK